MRQLQGVERRDDHSSTKRHRQERQGLQRKGSHWNQLVSCRRVQSTMKITADIIRNLALDSNFGDVSTITNTCAKSVTEICTEYQGNTNGAVSDMTVYRKYSRTELTRPYVNLQEPPKLRSGPSAACKYTAPLPACS